MTESIYSYYKIKSANYTFWAEVTKAYEGLTYKISFGSKKTPCIHIDLYVYESYANLNALSYKESCSMGHALKRGNGTIEMVHACFNFINQMKNQWGMEVPLLGFIFKDDSKIKIDSDIFIRLPIYYFAKYGKTWYQDKFDAIPIVNDINGEKPAVIDSNILKGMDKMNHAFTTKNVMAFNDFVELCIENNNNLTKNQKVTFIKLLQPIYQQSYSFRDFILKLDKTFKIVIFWQWLDTFINKIAKKKPQISEWSNPNLYWMIKNPILHNVIIYEETMYGGGKIKPYQFLIQERKAVYLYR